MNSFSLPRSKSARVLIGITAAVILFLLVFDWDWLRPAILRHLSENSHRAISASHLDVDFSWSLQPTIRLHDLQIENAPWAGQIDDKPGNAAAAIKSTAQRPLVAVKEIAFSFAAFKMLFAEKRLISRIYIRDGEVNLEQLENGMRNWRLLEPEYTGPGKYIIMALQAENSTIRFRHHGIQLDLQAVTKPYTGISAENTSVQLTNAIALQGNYKGSPFDGQLHTGPLLTFQRTGLHFPIDGYIHSAKTRFGVKGELGDLFLDQHINADLSMSGNTLAAFNPFMNMNLPASPAFEASAHLLKQQNRYRANSLQGKLGGTDLQGELTYINDKKQPLLEGKLNSKVVNLDELTAMGANAEQADAAGKQSRSSRTSGNADQKRLFSHDDIPIAGLNARDMYLSLNIGQLKASKWPALQNINTTMTLDKGRLKLQPLHATLQGSDIAAQFDLHASQQPLVAKLTLTINKLPMQHLLANSGFRDMVSAPLSTKVDIQGQGRSIAGLVADASGNIRLTLAPGSISNKLDAKLGLDAGKMLWLAVRGDKTIAMHCAVMDIAFDHGIGTTRTLQMDSAQTTLLGSGKLNLRDETVQFVLIPRPKDPSLLSIESAIQVYGPLRQPKFTLERNATTKKLAGTGHANSNSGC